MLVQPGSTFAVSTFALKLKFDENFRNKNLSKLLRSASLSLFSAKILLMDFFIVGFHRHKALQLSTLLLLVSHFNDMIQLKILVPKMKEKIFGDNSKNVKQLKMFAVVVISFNDPNITFCC